MGALALCVALLATGCDPAVEPPGDLLLEGARVFVGDGTVVEDGAILVSGDRIAAVGEAGSVEPDGDPVRLDLSGRTVIPALVDAHAHLGYEGYTGWGAEHYTRENLVDHLHRYAYYGFGAVLSAGSDPADLALEIQETQRSGEIGGARFLFAAGMAPPEQGPNDRFLVHTGAVSRRMDVPVVRGLSSPEDARREVREVAERGIPFVKVWVDDRGGTQEKLSPPVYRAAMDEARDRGLEVLVHQQTAGDMPDLIRSGADGFLHGRLGPELDGEVAALLAREDVFVVPNLGLVELRDQDLAADPFLREAVAPRVVARLDSAEARVVSPVPPVSPDPSPRPDPPDAPDAAGDGGGSPNGTALSRLTDAGVPVVLGTDAGAVPDHFFGYTGHRELEILVRLGMTPTEALLSATREAARALGLDEMGTLEPGKSADFVILEADPREDIRNTRTIVDVYLRGQRVDREGFRAAWRGEDEDGSTNGGG